jgi:GAF domain-containing protein
VNPTEALNLLLNNPYKSKRAVLEKVCDYAQQIIPSANLISLWRFTPDRNSIVSLINFDAQSGEYKEGLELRRDDFPKYFENIVEHELIVASDARNHSATRCFNEAYFEPNDIHSLLDFILHKDFAPVGVICCESKGKQVDWTDEDIDNIRMVATMISFFFEV